MRRRSAAVVRLVSSSTRTGRSPSSEPSARRPSSPSSSCTDAEVVLLGEHLGRRHERALVAALHRRRAARRARRRSCPTRRRPAAAGASAPGSPCRRVISSIARCWSPVSANGSCVEERRRRARRRRVCAIPDCSAASARLRGDEADLHAQELVEHEAALAPRRSSAIDSGRWIARSATLRSTRSCASRSSSSSGSAKPRTLHFGERLGDERAQLPGEHLGLARLRVDRHDHAGLLVGDTRPADARRRPGSSSGACRGTRRACRRTRPRCRPRAASRATPG